jgi:hypothetical protein
LPFGNHFARLVSDRFFAAPPQIAPRQHENMRRFVSGLPNNFRSIVQSEKEGVRALNELADATAPQAPQQRGVFQGV